jgi:hypothetical protein
MSKLVGDRKMTTLTISNELTKLGMDKAQSDFIAQAIDERNQEAATKSDIKSVKSDIKSVKELLFFGFGAMSAALAYIVTKI